MADPIIRAQHLTKIYGSGETAVLGPFAPTRFNHLDQSVWLDVDAAAAVSVIRLGV